MFFLELDRVTLAFRAPIGALPRFNAPLCAQKRCADRGTKTSPGVTKRCPARGTKTCPGVTKGAPTGAQKLAPGSQQGALLGVQTDLGTKTCPGVTRRCPARRKKRFSDRVTKRCPDRGTKPGHLFVPRSGHVRFTMNLNAVTVFSYTPARPPGCLPILYSFCFRNNV